MLDTVLEIGKAFTEEVDFLPTKLVAEPRGNILLENVRKQEKFTFSQKVSAWE